MVRLAGAGAYCVTTCTAYFWKTYRVTGLTCSNLGRNGPVKQNLNVKKTYEFNLIDSLVYGFRCAYQSFFIHSGLL